MVESLSLSSHLLRSLSPDCPQPRSDPFILAQLSNSLKVTACRRLHPKAVSMGGLHIKVAKVAATSPQCQLRLRHKPVSPSSPLSLPCVSPQLFHRASASVSRCKPVDTPSSRTRSARGGGFTFPSKPVFTLLSTQHLASAQGLPSFSGEVTGTRTALAQKRKKMLKRVVASANY